MDDFLLVLLLQVKVALCQLAVTADKAHNIGHAREVIEKAADDGAQLILLPVSVSYWHTSLHC